MLKLVKKSLAGVFVLSLTACGSNLSNQLVLEQPVLNTTDAQTVDVLAHKYKIIDIYGIGDVYAKKLNDLGIKYADDYLKAAAKRYDREKLSQKTGISTKLLLTWANHVDLMRINGIGPKNGRFLEATGVDSVKELSHRLVDNLYASLEAKNKEYTYTNQLPTKNQVQSWIDESKKGSSVEE